MKFILLLTMFSLGMALPGIGQKTLDVRSKHFVKLQSGEVHEGSRLVYEYPLLQPAYFSLDDKRYSSEKVSFFRNNHGTFGNLVEFYGERSERYAMRISNNGKIQLFEEIDITAYGGDTLLTKNPRWLATGELWQFYTKDEGELKRGNYKNLKIDLSESTASMRYLKSYKRLATLQISMAAVGAGIIAQQLFVRKNESTVLSPQMILGGIMCGATFFFENPKADALWLAVDNYNK
jgi:hypothetical protein